MNVLSHIKRAAQWSRKKFRGLKFRWDNNDEALKTIFVLSDPYQESNDRKLSTADFEKLLKACRIKVERTGTQDGWILHFNNKARTIGGVDGETVVVPTIRDVKDFLVAEGVRTPESIYDYL
jgi:hypothetical protein